MTKAELITAVAHEANYTKVVVTNILNALNDVAIEALRNGDSVSLMQLGKLVPVTKAPREGRSPSDGSVIQIKGFKTAKLKVGKELRDALAE